jgi:hypothetical protein
MGAVATVTAVDTSAASVADPRDGHPSVAARGGSVSTVAKGGVAGAGLLDEASGAVTDEAGGFILLEDGS